MIGQPSFQFSFVPSVVHFIIASAYPADTIVKFFAAYIPALGENQLVPPKASVAVNTHTRLISNWSFIMTVVLGI